MASSNFFNLKSDKTDLKKGFVHFKDPGDKAIEGPFPAQALPDIITGGLVLWLDASTYVSGDWNSLVGNITASLYNTGQTITKQPNNGGVIQSTGLYSDDGFFIDVDYSTISYTIMIATKYMPGGVGGTDLQGRVLTGINNNWLLGNWFGHVNQYYASGWVYGPDEKDNVDWNIYTGTRSQSNIFSIYNGKTMLASNSDGFTGPNRLGIFHYGEPSYAQCGFLLVYDRLLSDLEIEQNYNVYKSRYGLN